MLEEHNNITNEDQEPNIKNPGLFASKISENPLIIIDGKVATKNAMDKLNPNSINSVNILKDKTATIKYGNKGKNGVIIITTKK
ncbi:hypothetical protein BZARG_03350 [Bizionia argentinensis JUB59]|uniref:TonB-dependent receptor plug domain-containing protein n=1 Tax=Bizionia argentinensis JUB59 TaxID=1046627 RepID=A0A4U8UKW7_9FLAO|nr:hypothetical protein BZARG_03350 [Bizionia argentinensis JUB59]